MSDVSYDIDKLQSKLFEKIDNVMDGGIMSYYWDLVDYKSVIVMDNKIYKYNFNDQRTKSL